MRTLSPAGCGERVRSLSSSQPVLPKVETESVSRSTAFFFFLLHISPSLLDMLLSARSCSISGSKYFYCLKAAEDPTLAGIANLIDIL